MSSNTGMPPVVAEAPPQVPSNQNARGENPPFNGWAVAKIGLLLFLVPVLVEPFVVLAAQKIVYPQLSFVDVTQKPWVILGPQFTWFAVMALYLISSAKKLFRESLWSAIRWNWPQSGWLSLVGIGLATLVTLQALQRVLPLPKKSPFDEFFRHPIDAYAFAVLAIAFAPFMEELFFRGFLYPVLARRLGIVSGIVLTAFPFALIHYFEYKSWGPVLIIFLVGVVLTSIRAVMKSVGASFVVHAIYNGVPLVAAIFYTHGF